MEPNKKPVSGYVFGGLSFIPLIGVVFGIIAIVIGVTKKTRGPVILGTLGILFTIVLYGNLWYWGFVSKTGPWAGLKVQLVEQLMNDDAGKIAIYERQNGKLPQKWGDLGEPSIDNVYYVMDPWMTEIRYTPHQDGTFELRSAGPDTTFETADDIIKNF